MTPDKNKDIENFKVATVGGIAWFTSKDERRWKPEVWSRPLKQPGDSIHFGGATYPAPDFITALLHLHFIQNTKWIREAEEETSRDLKHECLFMMCLIIDYNRIQIRRVSELLCYFSVLTLLLGCFSSVAFVQNKDSCFHLNSQQIPIKRLKKPMSVHHKYIILLLKETHFLPYCRSNIIRKA